MKSCFIRSKHQRVFVSLLNDTNGRVKHPPGIRPMLPHHPSALILWRQRAETHLQRRRIVYLVQTPSGGMLLGGWNLPFVKGREKTYQRVGNDDDSGVMPQWTEFTPSFPSSLSYAYNPLGSPRKLLQDPLLRLGRGSSRRRRHTHLVRTDDGFQRRITARRGSPRERRDVPVRRISTATDR